MIPEDLKVVVEKNANEFHVTLTWSGRVYVADVPIRHDLPPDVALDDALSRARKHVRFLSREPATDAA